MTNQQVLNKTALSMVEKGRGILAMDESHPTCDKRFKSLGIPTTEAMRQQYRSMLVTAPDLGNYISGAILFDETIRQTVLGDDTPFPQHLKACNIIPGIKVDGGAKPFQGSEEKLTAGLDGLADRLREYAGLGARFAKWRAVINIDDVMPSQECVSENAIALAKYAKCCQDQDIVPIVEPEVLMDGAHTIERCFEVTRAVQSTVFAELNKHGVLLEGIVLKPNMVVPGALCETQADAQTIAQFTLDCLMENVPSEVPGIAFLSGGQSDIEASDNLNAVNLLASERGAPWKLTFSYGRALQQAAMKTWGGKEDQVAAAQAVIQQRAKLNSLASTGQYDTSME